MIVKVNCPIAGCGIQVQVQSLSKHLEKVHELDLDGEMVIRLHPTSPYTVTYKAEPEPEPEPEPEKEAEPEPEPEPEEEAGK